MKAALVEHFLDKAAVLIAKEAAADGSNLRFAALVDNLACPWNP